ncbi:hypothetical protein A4G19_06890 [Pasteurellaceae bacterium Macca]|nr:hypothetical protein [Pasteurellaceae bacterium Macca]
MSFLKYLILALLPLTLSVNHVYAETKSAKSTKSTKSTKKAKKQNQQDKSLAAFNQNFGIKLVARSIVADKNNQPISVFKYELENKGNHTIQSAHWESFYVYGKEILFSQDFPLGFGDGLSPKQKVTIEAHIPLAQIPEKARVVISNLNSPIGAQNTAKNLTFADGTKVNVK